MCMLCNDYKQKPRIITISSWFVLKATCIHPWTLYVALSRVKSRAGAKLLILDKEGNVTNQTTNVVYKEIFRDL
ncbi:hypothetical protein HanXRQr2_Chr16g0766541 [Helianthus annuus]|uniref:Uncharacterized protein n=1 Tax=Helianthus annuus TaxID=4232 RepID=A0A9K3GZI5_HELAN|nr:hypothetical protein HanXRQr2_Chr16g0766541 [Helianthus annuus]